MHFDVHLASPTIHLPVRDIGKVGPTKPWLETQDSGSPVSTRVPRLNEKTPLHELLDLMQKPSGRVFYIHKNLGIYAETIPLVASTASTQLQL